MQGPGFRLEFKNEIIFLCVFPADLPKGILSPAPVLEALLETDYSSFNYIFDTTAFEALIEKDWSKTNKNWVKQIAIRQEFKLETQISEDKMQAHINLFKAYQGEVIHSRRLIEKLKLEGIQFGYIKQALKAIENSDEMNIEQCLIAQGSAPSPGKAGEIECVYLQKRFWPDQPRDFDSQKEFFEVYKDQVILIRRPPLKPQPGHKVTGEVHHSKTISQLPKLRPLDYTQFAKNNLNIVTAKTSGYPVIHLHTARLEQAHIFTSPPSASQTTYSNSCIFNCTLSEKTIKTKGNIEVFGSLDGVYLEATGNIYIHGDMPGNSPSRLKAGGAIYAVNLNHSFVESGGILHIQNNMSHCQVFSFGPVLIQGSLSGGILYLLHDLHVQDLGHKDPVQTQIIFAPHPYYKNKADGAQRNLEDHQAQLDSQIKNLIKERMKKDWVSSDHLLEQNRLTQRISSEKSLAEVYAHYLNQKPEQVKVKVRGQLFPGVIFSLKNDLLAIEKTHKGPLVVEKKSGGLRLQKLAPFIDSDLAVRT